MAKQIIIDHVFKVYGDQPEAARELVHEGASKQDILSRTACTIGVVDASFTIEAGEIFVIMGLSGSGKSTLVRMLNRMVVIASMIAVGGLGQMVLRGTAAWTWDWRPSAASASSCWPLRSTA